MFKPMRTSKTQKAGFEKIELWPLVCSVHLIQPLPYRNHCNE